MYTAVDMVETLVWVHKLLSAFFRDCSNFLICQIAFFVASEGIFFFVSVFFFFLLLQSFASVTALYNVLQLLFSELCLEGHLLICLP